MSNSQAPFVYNYRRGTTQRQFEKNWILRTWQLWIPIWIKVFITTESTLRLSKLLLSRIPGKVQWLRKFQTKHANLVTKSLPISIYCQMESNAKPLLTPKLLSVKLAKHFFHGPGKLEKKKINSFLPSSPLYSMIGLHHQTRQLNFMGHWI